MVQRSRISVGLSIRYGIYKDTHNSCAESQGKTLEQALDTFVQATHSVLLNAGKTPVVWEGMLLLQLLPSSCIQLEQQEMALEHQVKLHNQTIVLCVNTPSTPRLISQFV